MRPSLIWCPPTAAGATISHAKLMWANDRHAPPLTKESLVAKFAGEVTDGYFKDPLAGAQSKSETADGPHDAVLTGLAWMVE
jgi:hypothetical protein